MCVCVCVWCVCVCVCECVCVCNAGGRYGADNVLTLLKVMGLLPRCGIGRRVKTQAASHALLLDWTSFIHHLYQFLPEPSKILVE